jgi:hypothetical protein
MCLCPHPQTSYPTLIWIWDHKKNLVPFAVKILHLIYDHVNNPVFSHRFQNMKPVVLQLHHMMGIKIVRKYYVFGLPFYLIEDLYPKRFRNIVSVSEETLRKY